MDGTSDAMLVHSLNIRTIRLLDSLGSSSAPGWPSSVASLPTGARRPDRCEALYATYDAEALNPRVCAHTCHGRDSATLGMRGGGVARFPTAYLHTQSFSHRGGVEVTMMMVVMMVVNVAVAIGRATTPPSLSF
jgi:hypothetical protein